MAPLVGPRGLSCPSGSCQVLPCVVSGVTRATPILAERLSGAGWLRHCGLRPCEACSNRELEQDSRSQMTQCQMVGSVTGGMTSVGAGGGQRSPRQGGAEPQLVQVHVTGNRAVFGCVRQKGRASGTESPTSSRKGSGIERRGPAWGSVVRHRRTSPRTPGRAEAGTWRAAPQAPCGVSRHLSGVRTLTAQVWVDLRSCISDRLPGNTDAAGVACSWHRMV